MCFSLKKSHFPGDSEGTKPLQELRHNFVTEGIANCIGAPKGGGFDQGWFSSNNRWRWNCADTL